MELFPFSSQVFTELAICGESLNAYAKRLEEVGIRLLEGVFLAEEDVKRLLSLGMGACLTIDGTVVATHGLSEGCGGVSEEASENSVSVKHAWDLLKVCEQQVGQIKSSKILGEVHPQANVDGELHLGQGSQILPGVYIEGNVTIGENCKIGPNCYIRGNTSIGDGCRIGQSVEIKNCLIGSKTNVGHLSYVGDSVLGNGVNFGAGTTVSNLRHDGKNHRSLINGSLIDTGRRKFGTVVGHGVHTGINTSLYPGRKMGKNTTSQPGEIIKKDKNLCAE